jgi:hypothetical protein
MVAGQRGEQTRPLRLAAMPPQARRPGAWLPARCRPRGSARAASRPRTGGHLVATGGAGIWLGSQPGRCHMVALLASRADHPADGALRPARDERAGPVIGLSKGSWIREDRLAPCHVAPGGRQADLVTDDAVLGDRDRVCERVGAPGRLWDVTVRVRPRTGEPSPGHPASPAG